jgi:serine phosphatase RsbU (regulator of sigma subunit)
MGGKTTAELEKRIETLEHELAIRDEINDRIHLDQDRDKIIIQIVDAVLEHADIELCNFFLVDENGQMHVFRVQESKKVRESIAVEKASTETLDYLMQWSADLKTHPSWACVAARENREIYVPHAKPLWEKISLLKDQGITGCYFLPVNFRDTVYGTMVLLNYTGPMELGEEEKEVIRTRVRLIARVLEDFEIYSRIKKQKEELERKNGIITEDLLMARRIQMNLLPEKLPVLEDLEIAAFYQPMFEVGGDYYDFVPGREGENEVGVFLMDASGHGVGAAFITSMVKMALDSAEIRQNPHEPEAVLKYINKTIMDKTAGNFLTAVYCYFDLKERKVKLARAGHTDTYRIRGEEMKTFHPKGKVLGFLDDLKFEVVETDLKKGDRFFFYTDGLTEAVDGENREFEEVLETVLTECSGKTPEAMNGHIMQKLKIFTGSESFEDDIALVSVGYSG